MFAVKPTYAALPGGTLVGVPEALKRWFLMDVEKGMDASLELMYLESIACKTRASGMSVALLVAVMLIRPPAEMLQDGSFGAALAAHMTARETRMVWLDGAVVLRFAGPPGGAVKVLQLKFKGALRVAFCATVRVGVKASSTLMVIEDWKCIYCLR